MQIPSRSPPKKPRIGWPFISRLPFTRSTRLTLMSAKHVNSSDAMKAGFFHFEPASCTSIAAGAHHDAPFGVMAEHA